MLEVLRVLKVLLLVRFVLCPRHANSTLRGSLVWQLADRLQNEIFEFTSHPPASRDFKYCDQIRDSIRSAKRNTSEGFGRYYPKEFARFLRITAGSLQETKNHLQDGLKQQYLSAERHERLKRLCLRAMKANVRLIAYLRTAKAPEPFQNPEPREPREPREP